ncbi:MAG: T9SS type A sorting domain-containing protein [Armatimonadetes bacterium]|nr:T9SS type A sorting domain-containing protein [Armatimonadota bacterium]
MKIFFILIILIVPLNLFCILAEQSTPLSNRDFDNTIHDAGNVLLRVSNYGFLGSGDQAGYPSLEFPPGSAIDYLYHGAIWVGAKKIRRNDEGFKLYWVGNPSFNNEVIPENHPNWNPSLQLVVDTLTTVGFDGDHSLYEMLPAYNVKEISALGQQYSFYWWQDVVLKNIVNQLNYDNDGDGLIDEDPLGMPFELYDPDSLFCFTIPTDEDEDGLIDEDSDYPGYETSIGYYYDYSPFGTPGDRDWGSSQSSNIHIPLEIAVNQQVYTYPVQYYADMVILKHKIFNASLIDTLFDVSVGFYMDCDIGPQAWGSQFIAPDDVSSYVGAPYEFAYAFDWDGDGGLTTGLLGFKLFGEQDYEFSCWTWSVGNGPDDWDPLDYVGTTRATANEKYWLMTDRNPDDSKYTSLRDFPNTQIGNPVDTRFLYSICGDMQGFANPTENSINIPPGEFLDFYSVIMMGNTVTNLQQKTTLIEYFYNSGFDYSVFGNLPSIPYLIELQNIGNGTSIWAKWDILSQADELRLYYKERNAPAYTWEYELVDPTISEHVLDSLENNTFYKIKVAAIFDSVYLESRTLEIETTSSSSEPDEILMLSSKLYYNYPNPFNPETTIYFTLEYTENAEISIYNLKGQKIRKYLIFNNQSSIIWDGKDEEGKSVTSGVYFYRLKTGKINILKKMLLIK